MIEMPWRSPRWECVYLNVFETGSEARKGFGAGSAITTENAPLIEHRLTKPNHPWTNGQVERMNRKIKEATVKRLHYDSHEQLRTHLADFMAAYNFARRLKTLGGLTPYEYICKMWTSEPDRFILNPIHQMPGLNS